MHNKRNTPEKNCGEDNPKNFIKKPAKIGVIISATELIVPPNKK